MKTQCIISASLQVFCRRYLTASSALERKSLAEEAGFWEAIPPSPPPCANLMLRLCARACVRARRSVLWTLEAIHLVPNARDGYHYHLIPFCEPQAIAVKRALRRPAVHSVLPGRNQEKTGETCVLRDLGSTVRSVLWESQVCIGSTRATSLNHKF